MLGFFTRLPVGSGRSFDDLVAAFPLVCLVGWVTGVLSAAAAVGFGYAFPAGVSGALLLAVMVGLTGMNQTDGLLDLGDGLMVHGDAERRREIMRDHTVGAGGSALMFFTYLVAYAGFVDMFGRWAVPQDAWRLVAAVVLVEVLARVPFLLLALLGRPSHPGLGSAVLEGFTARHFAVGLLVAAPAVVTSFAIGWIPVVLAAASVVMVSGFMVMTAHSRLGGIGGDVMGATQELSRSALIVAVVAGAAL